MNSASTGIGCLARGFGWILRRPRLLAIGAVPALTTSVIYLIVLIIFGFQIPALADRLTWFAADWAPWLDLTLQVAASVLLFAGAVVVMVVVFSSLTLLIGGPFYERIATAVEAELGGAPEGQAREIGNVRSVGMSLTVVILGLLGTIVFFLLGLVPVVGTIIGLVGNSLVGGWLIALELVGQPAAQRGITTLRGRNQLMKRSRAAVWGFGVPTFWLLSIPLVAVIVFPAAAVGGVLLTRRLSGEAATLTESRAGQPG